MKKLLFGLLLFASVSGISQFLIFLDKGDVFKSPEVDMAVMDKYSFARMHYVAEKYDTLKKEVLRYDSLLTERDCTVNQLRETYENVILNKEAQLRVVSEGYHGLKSTLQSSIEENKRLQIDYLKLEKKNRRIKRWRNFFMGTSFVFGGIIYMVVR